MAHLHRAVWKMALFQVLLLVERDGICYGGIVGRAG